MEDTGARARALKLWEEAQTFHMRRELPEAIRLYRASLAVLPTAEAHTFLGWALSWQGDVDGAIEECKRAILVDPSLGNPYNDIGSYLIKLERFDEAIPWLERALTAERYEARHYPHCNLGRIYWQKGQLLRALAEFKQALALDPGYAYAADALARIQQQLN
jgi:Tfp pilus assembly protein PilF